MTDKMNVGIYIFENMTMLDGFAPLQILSFVEQFNTFTFALSKEPLRSDSGAMLTPDYDLESCPPLDILVMPGGGDVLPQMTNPELQAFLKQYTAHSQTRVKIGASPSIWAFSLVHQSSVCKEAV